MALALGLVLTVAVAASGFGAWRLIVSPRRVLSPERETMREALLHATATLPHLRRGLDRSSARAAAGHLRTLTQAGAVAITDADSVLAVDGPLGRSVSSAELLELARSVEDDRVHVEPRAAERATSAVIAPLMLQGSRIGALIALFGTAHRLRPDDARVVGSAAALVSGQLELSVIASQEERMIKAELLALRARISPHFVYNSLAAIASYIHSSPDEARVLLTEFAEFTRYAFRGERPYVTLAEELHYVEKYLRLEQARFRDRLAVRVQVEPTVLQAVVPVLCLQPLVENAVKHGVEARAGSRTVEIVGIDRDGDVELRITDDGAGMSEETVAAALSGESGGMGLSNVDRRLRATFGEDYGLEIDASPGQGTTVVLVVPKYRVGVRAA